MNEREREIIQLARGFLTQLSQQKTVDEAAINANFLFRFESVWCEWISKIRQMMWAMMGESSDTPLSSESGARLLVHLESNPGLSVGVNITPEGTTFTMTTATGNYRCLDRDLREKHQAAIRHFATGGDIAEIDRLHQQMWAEANQTTKIQDELWRLARAYQLVSVTDEFSLRETKERFQRVVTWVIWAEVVPSFLWPKTILLESKTPKRVKRTLRPHKWSEHIFPTQESGLRLETRVRTWAIYYLTRRGGGERTEQSAVDLWNEQFPCRIVTDLRIYRSERERLLKHGGKKDKLNGKNSSF